MARPSNLAKMSVEALLELRDDIAKVLSRRSEQLQSQLAALGLGDSPRGKRGGSLKGKKVAPKYRNPKNRSETWAGRGAMPRWMAAEIKKGKKREDFAISKSGAKAKRAPVKKPRRTKKGPAKAAATSAAPSE